MVVANLNILSLKGIDSVIRQETNYNVLKENVFNAQRYSIYDGPDIRTTVFLKGCPLKCY